MKFIIHLSSASRKDYQSNIWFKQISQRLQQDNYDIVLGDDLPKENSIIELCKFSPTDENEYHVIFLSGKKDIFWSNVFKKMDKPPHLIWFSLDIYPEMLEPEAVLPEHCIVPCWRISDKDAKHLSNKVTLVRPYKVNHSNLDITEYKSKLLEKYSIDTGDEKQKNIFCIQLESSQKSNCFSSAYDFDLFVSTVSNNIKRKISYGSTAHVFVAPPLSKTKNDIKNTNHFIKVLGEKLSFSNVNNIDWLVNLIGYYQFFITEIGDFNQDIKAPSVMLCLLEEWTRATYYVPKSDQDLVAKSMDVIALGVNTFAYGRRACALSNAMSNANFLTSFSYFKKVGSKEQQNSIPMIDGASIEESLQQIVSDLKKRFLMQKNDFYWEAKAKEDQQIISDQKDKEVLKPILRRPSIDISITPPEQKYYKENDELNQNANLFWQVAGAVAATAIATTCVMRSKLLK